MAGLRLSNEQFFSLVAQVYEKLQRKPLNCELVARIEAGDVVVFWQHSSQKKTENPEGRVPLLESEQPVDVVAYDLACQLCDCREEIE